MRRIVTGIDACGKSVFVSDGPTPQRVSAGSGFEMGTLWGTAGATALGDSGTDAALAAVTAVPPAPGASAFVYVVIPPDAQQAAEFDPSAAAPEFHVEDDGRMHRTDTIDYGVLVRGELWLELDDGREQLLRAGDCFVQNGTRHAWHNRGTVPAVICVAMLGIGIA